MAERAARDVSIGSDGDTLRAFRAAPASGRGPGVLVVHEARGLLSSTRDVCERLAREGFVALAPDLHRGQTARDPEAARRLVTHLEVERATRDLDAAVRALLDDDAVEGARLGCIGFDMGGQLALHAAMRNPRIGAVVDCYGAHPLDLAVASGRNADVAVLGIFGGDDTVAPPETARSLESELRRSGVRTHFRIVEGAGHGFLDDGQPDRYDARAAAEAWRDILAFLRAELE